MKARLLIVEDEPAMRMALAETLSGHGYRVTTAATGPEGLAAACEHPPDLILLDAMLPGLDGYAVCCELRRRELHMPVLMLTAKAMVNERVKGLEAGADDYLVKPFSMKELFARVRALLRRVERAENKVERLCLGDVRFDFIRQTCDRNGEPVELSTKEMQMMRLLAEHAGEPVTREHFLDVIWEYNAYPTSRTVDNYIASLRSKIEPDPTRPRYVTTVRGIGYILDGEMERMFC